MSPPPLFGNRPPLWTLIAGGVAAFSGVTLLGIRHARAVKLVPVDEPNELPATEPPDQPEEAIPPIVPPIVTATLTPETLITPHFTYQEFSQHACPAKGLPITAYPAAWVEERLRPLCTQLEVIREAFGRTITVNSAYRSPLYNSSTACTGGTAGAPRSQHVYGRAVDIVVKGVDAQIVYNRVLQLHQTGKIKIGGLGKYARFTHVDIRPGKQLVTWG